MDPILIGNVVSFIGALFMMLMALNLNAVSTCIYAVVVLFFELIVWSFVFISVESGLRKLLGIKED